MKPVDVRKWYVKVWCWIKYKSESVKHKICNEGYVGWEPSFQSYFSAGDEAEPYCVNCETYLEDDDVYCRKCGVKLLWD